eukprot:scaffold686_cov177-Ochromonas_danica.AAC.13
MVQPVLVNELPLRDVTWKSPISASFITIDKLPLRFLPSSASLFKETEHAFRWLLAPYVQLYLLVSESLDAYKTAKANLKKWVDLRNTTKTLPGKSPWFIVYLPLGTQSLETYNKIYYRVSNDFYADRTGDHSVMLLLPSLLDESNSLNILTKKTGGNGGNSMSFSLNMSSHSHAVNSLSLLTTSHLPDLFSLLREGIVKSFQQRCALYDNEIRRLDAGRAMPGFDLKQLFLVKESLALMYQMMQLADMALAQYEELEALLSFAAWNTLPDSDWPMVSPMVDSNQPGSSGGITSSSSSSTTGPNDGVINGGTNNVDAPPPPPPPLSTPSSSREKDLFSDAVKNGDDIVAYSINLSRMKILRNKMSLLEYHRYLYARQIFFLVQLQRPVQCATKSRGFLLFVYNAVWKKLGLMMSSSPPPTTSASVSASSDQDKRDKAVKMMQLKMWLLNAAVKVVRVCKDLIHKMTHPDDSQGGGNGATNNGNGKSGSHLIATNVVESQSVLATVRLQRLLSTSSLTAPSTTTENELELAGMGSSINEVLTNSLDGKAVVIREAYAILADILQLASTHFQQLSPIVSFARCYSLLPHTSDQSGRSGQLLLQVEEESRDSNNSNEGIEESLDSRKIFEQRVLAFIGSCQGDSLRAMTSQDLDGLRVDKADFLSNRLRSVSHFWAKLYSTQAFDYTDPDNWRIDRDYPTLRKKASFLNIQQERGLSLEVVCAVLLFDALGMLYSQTDQRGRFAYTMKLQTIPLLLVGRQFAMAVHMLDLLWRQEAPYLMGGAVGGSGGVGVGSPGASGGGSTAGGVAIIPSLAKAKLLWFAEDMVNYHRISAGSTSTTAWEALRQYHLLLHQKALVAYHASSSSSSSTVSIGTENVNMPILRVQARLILQLLSSSSSSGPWTASPAFWKACLQGLFRFPPDNSGGPESIYQYMSRGETLILPLSLFFRTTISTVAKVKGKIGDVGEIDGDEIVQEKRGFLFLPDQPRYAVRFHPANPRNRYLHHLTWQCLLPCSHRPFLLDDIIIVYRKVQTQPRQWAVLEGLGSLWDSARNLQGEMNTAVLNQLLTVGEDEFRCSVLHVHIEGQKDEARDGKGEQCMIGPGDKVVCTFALTPPSLGDYFLHRIILISGRSAFIDLPLLSTIAQVTDQVLTSSSTTTSSNTSSSSSSFGNHAPTFNAASVCSSNNVSIRCWSSSISSPKPFMLTQDELIDESCALSATHRDLQTFFDHHPLLHYTLDDSIVKESEATDGVLAAKLYLPRLCEWRGRDCVVVRLQTLAAEALETIRIDVKPQYHLINRLAGKGRMRWSTSSGGSRGRTVRKRTCAIAGIYGSQYGVGGGDAIVVSEDVQSPLPQRKTSLPIPSDSPIPFHSPAALAPASAPMTSASGVEAVKASDGQNERPDGILVDLAKTQDWEIDLSIVDSSTSAASPVSGGSPLDDTDELNGKEGLDLSVSIPGSRLMTMRIPFAIQPSSEDEDEGLEEADDDGDKIGAIDGSSITSSGRFPAMSGLHTVYEIPLEVRISGKMRQTTCSLAFDITYQDSLLVTQGLAGYAQHHLLFSSSPHEEGEKVTAADREERGVSQFCLDCHLKNLSPLTLYLVGYSLAVFKDGQWIEVSAQNHADHGVDILMGPLDLQPLEEVKRKNQVDVEQGAVEIGINAGENNDMVQLQPDENYAMQILYSTTKGNLSSPSLYLQNA